LINPTIIIGKRYGCTSLHAHVHRWAETPVGRQRERERDGRVEGWEGGVSSTNRQTTAKYYWSMQGLAKIL